MSPQRATKRRSTPRHREPAEKKAPRIPGLSARPVWQGNLQLSLVNCAVSLYSAVSRSRDISFHLLNPETNNRIRMVPTDPDTGPVERSDLVKGYEIEKNRYVVMKDEELESVRLQTTRALTIERFVDASSIDRLFWNDPYILLPADETAVNAYAVIRAAMEQESRMALGRLVMHTRERLMAIEPRGKGLVAYTLRVRDEVIDIDKVFETIDDVKPDKQMVEIARKIIEQQEGPFAPEEFRDRYEDALREVIAAKERGEALVEAAEPEATNVIDLMDALKRSLAAKGKATTPMARAAPAAKKRKSR